MKHTFKRVEIKIFAPGNKKCTKVVYTAPPGELYTQRAVGKFVEAAAAEIAQTFPNGEYSIVPLARNRFNFVHRCAHA